MSDETTNSTEAATLPFETPGVDVPTNVATDAPGTVALPRPVIRWAAIVWGLVFAGIAAVVLTVVTDASRRDDVADWFGRLTPGTGVLYAVLVIGVIVLLAGVAGLLRRATRPRP